MVFNVDAVFIHTKYVDLRKSQEYFIYLIREQMHMDITEPYLFIFFNRARDRIKLLHFDGTGFWNCSKHLSVGRFQCRELLELPTPIILPKYELTWFLAGLKMCLIEDVLSQGKALIF